MKTKTRNILAAVVFVGFLLAGIFAVFAYKAAEAFSIVNVLNQNAKAVGDSMQIRGLGRRSVTNFNTGQYVIKLHKIDTSPCPKKFQLAWLDYVHAWEQEAQQTPGRMLGEAYFTMLGVATRSSSLGNVGAKPIEAANELERTRQQLERVALEYNVRIIRQ